MNFWIRPTVNSPGTTYFNRISVYTVFPWCYYRFLTTSVTSSSDKRCKQKVVVVKTSAELWLGCCCLREYSKSPSVVFVLLSTRWVCLYLTDIWVQFGGTFPPDIRRADTDALGPIWSLTHKHCIFPPCYKCFIDLLWIATISLRQANVSRLV